MLLKPPLPFQRIGALRLVLGLIAGIAFAASFYIASLKTARAAAFVTRDLSSWRVVDRAEWQNRYAEEYGFPLVPVPEIVDPVEAEVPGWLAPFWAGLAAVFGQALTLFVWFMRPQVPGLRARRAGLHTRMGVTRGLMWIGLIPLILGKLWLIHLFLVYGGNVYASALGLPGAADPLVPIFPFGMTAGLLVVFLALEPWRPLQLVYRCRWWPALSVVGTLVLAVLLYGIGQIV